jgi:hypothetical protein
LIYSLHDVDKSDKKDGAIENEINGQQQKHLRVLRMQILIFHSSLIADTLRA